MNETPNKVIVGFKETKELLDLAFVVGFGIEDSIKDGQFNLGDVLYFTPILTTLGPALDNLGEVPLEFQIADEGEFNQLKAYINEKFAARGQNGDINVYEFIEDAFSALAGIWLFVRKHFLKSTEEASNNEDIKPESTNASEDNSLPVSE